MNIKPLLKKAEQLLTENPRDDIHDLSHHQRVWENAQRILKSIHQDVNTDVLHVATMWHDVMITKESLSLGSEGLLRETIKYLQELMNEHGVSRDFQTAVIDAMKHHNFLTKYQRSIESKILFDADKLDALNPIRYKRIIHSIQNKNVSKFQIFLIAKAAKLWLKTMRSRYHFPLSRELHDQLIANLLKDKEAVQLAKEWNVDIVRLVK